MRYELSQLGPDGFERLIQSLLAGETYGDGPDGQRECVIRNAKRILALPDLQVSGYLMAQAKFKSPEGAAGDWDWLRNNLHAELEGFRAKARQNEKLKEDGKEDEIYQLPDTWMFFTNIVLTPALNTGLKDKADQYTAQYHDLIPNIYILGADDVKTMLDNRPMVAAAYPTLINDGLRSYRAMRTYVGLRFSDYANVDLKQAGDETGHPVDLRDVYTDLSVQWENETRSFTELIVGMSEKIFAILENKGDSDKGYQTQKAVLSHALHHGHITTRFTLLGEAGKGKSTVCRLMCQIYRAALLREERDASAAATAYLEAPEGTEALPIPRYSRIPITVTLKEFAAWLHERSAEASDLLCYLLHKINERTNAQLSADDLLTLFRSEAWFFCFDGLDEVPVASNRGLVVDLLLGFLDMLEQQGCNYLSVLTSRPQGYGDSSLLERFEQITLLPMEPERCMGYLRRLLPHLEQDPEERNAKLRIMQNALQDAMTAKLMETPLYATILLILARSGGRLPSRRYDLFKEYCETVTRRERQKGLLADLEGSYNWVLQVHREIALLLQRESNTKENAAAELTLDRLNAILVDYLKRQDFEDDNQMRADTMRESITRRLPFLAQTTNSEGQACVLFPLRSIQEYYAAEGIVAPLDQNKIGNALKEISSSTYWRNVFLFAAGCLTGDLDRYDLLNERLYGICRMNNGDPAYCEEVKAQDRYAITNLGSRLALDLLREGVFTRRLDKERYCALLKPLLREKITDSNPFESRQLRNLTELPPDILQKLLAEVLIPLLKETRDGDCLGFTLLWVMANGNETVPAATEALAVLFPQIEFAKSDTWLRLIRGGYEPAPLEVRERLYALARESFVGYPDYIPHINWKEFVRYLAYTARENNWKHIPVTMLRSLLYHEIGERGLMRGYLDSLADIEPVLLGEGAQPVRALLNRRMRSKDDFFAFSSVPLKDEIPETLPVYLDALRARQLFDLAALLALQADPSPITSQAVIEAWNTLDEHLKPWFLQVLECGNWYCQSICKALYWGEAAEEKILSREEIEAQEKRLRTWIMDPAAAIRADHWENYIYCLFGWDGTGYICKPKLELPEVLCFLRSRPLCREHWELLDVLTDDMSCYPPELTSFLLEHLPELETAGSGNKLLLRLFLELQGSELLCGRFDWPQVFPQWDYYRMQPERLSRIESRIQELIAGTEFAVWEACAMIPYLASVHDIEELVTLPKGSYTKILETGNQIACLGGILALLSSDLDQVDRIAMTGDLNRFLSDKNTLWLFDQNCRCFSADGKYFLYQLIQEVEPADDTQQKQLISLMDKCITGLRSDMEDAAVCLRAI